MSMIDYYEESVAAALDDQGIKASPAQVSAISESLRISADNESLASGSDCIPNPLESQMREQEKGHQRQVVVFDKRIEEKDKFIEELKSEIRHLRYELHEARTN